MGSFLDYIHFKYIPCDVLVKEVYPLKIVPNFTMIRALAHQVRQIRNEKRIKCNFQADPTLDEFPSMDNLALSPSPSPANSPQPVVLRRHMKGKFI